MGYAFGVLASAPSCVTVMVLNCCSGLALLCCAVGVDTTALRNIDIFNVTSAMLSYLCAIATTYLQEVTFCDVPVLRDVV
jgi:hypothetical protein